MVPVVEATKIRTYTRKTNTEPVDLVPSIDVRRNVTNKQLSKVMTYAAISHAHLFRVWKQIKLSGSCLSTFHGFGSTKLSDILMPYPCSNILLTKYSHKSVS